MTKKVKEIIENMTNSGLVDKIHRVLVRMKKDGDITTDSEIPECFGKVADAVGLKQPSEMSNDFMRAFINIVDEELEKIFNLKVFAGYFVTESFKAVSKKNFSSLLESAVDSLYERRYDWEEDDDDDDNTNDYYKSYYRPMHHQEEEKPQPFVLTNDPRKITVVSDDRTMKLMGYQRASHLSDRGVGNTAYNGSYWMIRMTKNGITLSEEKVRNKREVIEKIYSLPYFKKVKEELA